MAISLAVVMVVAYSPPLQAPLASLYSYLLLAIGIFLLILGKTVTIIQDCRRRNEPVRCLDCGWSGSFAEWRRTGCCPDCDSRAVVREGED